MPLDPADERWLRERLDALDAQVGRLLADEQQTNRNFLALNRRLKSVERLKTAAIAGALGLGGAIATAIYWSGGIAADVKHAAEAGADVKALAKEFHEHELRTSTPKPEPAK